MTATILDGRAIASDIRDSLRPRVKAIVDARNPPPNLRIVLVGDDEANELYATRLQKSGGSLGVSVIVDHYAAAIDQATLAEAIESLNADGAVDAVVVAMPLPPRLPPEIVSTALSPFKDVDGITLVNSGRLYLGLPAHAPSTAVSIMEILRRSQISIRGKHAVVVGRSPVVGKPVAMLLLEEHATVTICHTRTADLAVHTRQADILVAAAGSARMIGASMIKPGAVVVDAGINPVEGGITGDVDFEAASRVAGAITPVPGGVGPLTNVLLLRSVVENAERRQDWDSNRGS